MISICRGWLVLVCAFCLMDAGIAGAQDAEVDTAVAVLEDTVAAAAVDTGSTVIVRVVHSNDLYGELFRGSGSDSLGGMVPRVHLIRRIQERGPAVVLDAGDAIGPATLSAWDKGKTMVDLMRVAGYTALAPGNHEFDYGLETFNKRQEQAGFPFLAANIVAQGGAELATIGHILVKAGGARIGIFGVVTPDITEQTNPRNVAGLTFGDPLKAARASIEALNGQGADYVIGVVHMPEEAVLALARRLSGVDLIVAGGHEKAGRPMLVRSLTRLVNGVQIVRTPRSGAYLGEVDITLVRSPGETSYSSVRADASLIQVDSRVPGDPDAEVLVRRLEEAYDRETGEALGQFAQDDLSDQAGAVANLMRWHTGSEIGVVNQGVFQPLPAQEPVYLRDVKRFIRFDDALVKLVLKGRQLAKIVRQSKRNRGSARGLIFAGLDPKEMRVNGRPIQDNEDYRVVALEFLAKGGDAYRDFRKASRVVPTGISLRSLVAGGLKVWKPLSSDAFGTLDNRSVWLSGWSVEGSFRRNYVNETTEEYRARKERVSFLRGETSIAWDVATDYFLGYEAGPNVLLFENATDFGQVGGTFDDLETSSDRLDSDFTYRRRMKGLKADPFLSTGVSTTLSSGERSRPFLWRNTAGFQKRFNRYLVGQFAARVQRNYAADESDYGAEVNLTYQRRLPQGGRFRSLVKTFFGFTDRKVISVQNYNTFSFPLAGDLNLTVRQSNFLYRVDKIQDEPVEGTAMRTDLTVGLAYGLDWKWF